jgi:protein-disulfide isomerase
MTKQNKIYLIVAIILILGGLILMAREGKAPGSGNGQTVAPVNNDDHVWGNSQAPVTMIVYSDFECPFCSKFAETMKQVEENFKDKVTITFRHYPLPGHPDAEKAAEASECAAEQEKFWEMHDKLFADNVGGRMSVEQFKKDAVDLGLNQEQFNQCLDSGKYKDKIAAQKAEGNKAGVTGTPTFFVNGNIYPGAYPFEDFTSPDGRQNQGLKSIISGFLNK